MSKWNYRAILGGLLFCLALSNDAWSLSCKRRIASDEAEGFTKQTLEDFTRSPMVAEGTIISVTDEVGSSSWSSVKGAMFKATHYYRKPDSPNTHDVYFITVRPDFILPGRPVLVFADPESEESRVDRITQPPHIPSEFDFGVPLPSSWTQRIWHANRPCLNEVYGVGDEHGRALLTILKRVEKQPNAPATLVFWTEIDDFQPSELSGSLPVPIESTVGSSAGRVVDVRLADPENRTEVSLSAGRYLLHWPVLNGFAPLCTNKPGVNTTCDVDLIPNGRRFAYARYRALGKLTVIAVDQNEKPTNFLGELRLIRKAQIGDAKFLPTQTTVNVRENVQTPLAEFKSGGGSPVIPGDYQMVAVRNTYQTIAGSSNQGPELKDDCVIANMAMVPIRWKELHGTSAFSLRGDIGSGESVILAELAEGPEVVRLRFGNPEHSLDIAVQPRCAVEFSGSVGGSNLKSLEVLALRAQQYTLKYDREHCYRCTKKAMLANESTQILVESKSREERQYRNPLPHPYLQIQVPRPMRPMRPSK